MKTFSDNSGRVWTVTVNVAAIKRVRALCNVDLNSIVEIKDDKPEMELLERLASDPVLLVDVLYAVCLPECEKKSVSDEDFGSAMAGDAIEHATNALLDEIIDFFPEAKRQILKKILSASRRFATVAHLKVKAFLSEENLEEKLVSELERLTGLSESVQESAQ